MMPTLRVSECRPTTGLLGGKALITKTSLIQVSSSSSEERVDYFGDDCDFVYEPVPSLDTSKFSHMTEEEIQVDIPETELPLGETATIESTLSISFIAFLVKHIVVVLTPAWMTLPEAAAITEGDTS